MSPLLPVCGTAVLINRFLGGISAAAPLPFVDFCAQSLTYWVLVFLATAVLAYLLRKNAALGLLIKVLVEIGGKTALNQRFRIFSKETDS
jgi:hypothetical protein